MARISADQDIAHAKALQSDESRQPKTIQQDYVKAFRYDTQRRFLSSTVGSKSRPEHRDDLDRSQTRARSRAFWKRRATIIGLLIAGVLVWKAIQMLGDKEKELAADRMMFKGYTLIKKERVSSTASIFHLRPTSKSMDEGIFQDWLRRGIMNLELKQPQIQVVRAYTPLPSMGPESTLRFLIRHEPNGEVSSWLYRLRINSQLEMRGPNYEFSIPSDTRSIIFLAGGTGIAPALQAAHGLLEQPRAPNADGPSPGNDKVIHILWASSRREECVGGVSDLKPPALFSRLASAPPTAIQASSLFSRLWKAATFQTGDAAPLASPPDYLNEASGSPGGQSQQGLIVRELEALKTKYPGQIFVSYFVDEESTFITEDSVRQALKAITAARFSSLSASASSAAAVRTASAPATQILVSGPDGFINALAGPKIWAEGRQIQGPVQGMLRKVLFDEQSAGKEVADVGVYKI